MELVMLANVLQTVQNTCCQTVNPRSNYLPCWKYGINSEALNYKIIMWSNMKHVLEKHEII